MKFTKIAIGIIVGMFIATGMASLSDATIVSIGPWKDTYKFPAAAKVNAFYGTPETVITIGGAVMINFEWFSNLGDFDNNKGTTSGLVVQETSLAVEGTIPDKMKIHMVLEQETPWDQSNEGGGSAEVGLERGWGELKAPWWKTVWIKMGLLESSTGLFGTVHNSDNYGIELRGAARKDVAWRFGWLKIIEALDRGGINNGVRPAIISTGPLGVGALVGAGPSSGRGPAFGGDEDMDIWYGNLVYTSKNLTFAPFLLWNSDRSSVFAPATVTAAPGTPIIGTVTGARTPGQDNDWFYIGADARGKINKFSLEGELVGLFGEVANEDLAAFLLYGNASYPFGKTTVRVGASWASGDDQVGDGDRGGFAATTGGRPTVFSPIWSGEHGLLGENVIPPIGFFGDQPLFADVFFGPFAILNNGNAPGTFQFNVGFTHDATKQFKIDGDLAWVQFTSLNDQSSSLAALTPARVPLNGDAKFDNAIGVHASLGATYVLSRNFFIDGSVAALFPSSGEAIEQLTGNDDVAWRIFVQPTFRF